MVSTFQDRNAGNAGLGWKAPVRAATTANLTLSAEQTVDGIALVEGDRVLVKDQSTAAENGIYIVRSGAWDRAPDWDGSGDVVEGTLIHVTNGTVNGDGIFEVSTTGTIIIGTTSVSFSSLGAIPTFSSQAQVNAGSSSTTVIAPSTLAGRPTFLATKGGTDQTGIATATDTKITFNTEEWDVGGYFNNSTWTPPAGKYRISAALFWQSGITANTGVQTKLYKNGASHRLCVTPNGGATNGSSVISVIVEANGSDTFEIYGRGTTASTLEVDGAITSTWFCGETI
jgi:hypothetical protein